MYSSLVPRSGRDSARFIFYTIITAFASRAWKTLQNIPFTKPPPRGTTTSLRPSSRMSVISPQIVMFLRGGVCLDGDGVLGWLVGWPLRPSDPSLCDL